MSRHDVSGLKKEPVRPFEGTPLEGGGSMVEIGRLRRGVRGQYAYDFNGNKDSLLYRESEDEEPKSVIVFAFVPAPPESQAETSAGDTGG